MTRRSRLSRELPVWCCYVVNALRGSQQGRNVRAFSPAILMPGSYHMPQLRFADQPPVVDVADPYSVHFIIVQILGCPALRADRTRIQVFPSFPILGDELVRPRPVGRWARLRTGSCP